MVQHHVGRDGEEHAARQLLVHQEEYTVGVTKLWRCWGHKGEVGYHGIKITVIMEQDQSFNNTESSDNNIDCFSHCNTGFSKASIILSTLNGDLVSAYLAKWEGAKEVFGSFVILIGSETLKNLCENQIPNDDWNSRQIGVKQVRLPRGNTGEIIDPYGCVDQNH